MVRWLARGGYQQRAVFRANTLMALRDAAAQGQGVTVLPCYLGDAHPALRRVGAPIDTLRGALWLLTHPDLRRVGRVRAFLDGMSELLAALRPMFEGQAS